MNTKETLERLTLPDTVKQSLAHLVEDLKRVAGDNLDGVVVYGGVARGSYTEGKSDINLIILLKDASGPRLDDLSPVLKSAWRNIGIDTMILTPGEVKTSADAFPVKFLHIKEFHLVLFGEDHFGSIEVKPEHLRLRLEQELRNLSLRLRKRYIAAASDGVMVARILTEAAAPLAVLLRTLLRLTGKTEPQDNSTASAFSAASSAFELDSEALAMAAAMRHDGKCAIPARDLYARFMQSVDRAVSVVDGLDPARKE
ncbi:MAG: nucleotidyltransferase domain-containing protein [Cyanobacteria bacterium HKST-UBA02]|nr:nucleotidyltransferase domain-containing protein [Cyanobacteria bacterium HKST-UBA02]